jgi:hypothetical protein
MPFAPGIIPTSTGQKLGGGSTMFAAGKQLDLWASPRHGKYYNAAYGATSYFACNQAGVTTSVGLNTTFVGLCVSNPAGSTVNLVIQKISGFFNVNATAAITGIGHVRGYSSAGVVTHTTPLSVYPTNTGVAATAGQGLADSACTIVGTPLWSGFTSVTAASTVAGAFFSQDLEGEHIIQPGGYFALSTIIASGTNGFFGYISWDEVPL